MGQWKKIKKEIIRYLETNKIGNIALQNLWYAAKAVLKRQALRPFSGNKKNLNKQPDLPHHKGIRKITNNAQSQQKEGLY